MSRQAIVDFALTLVGSHYLWGSGGDTPEWDNGVWYLSSSVALSPSSTDPNAPFVFAAQCKKSGFYVCAGRFKKVQNVGGGYVNQDELDSYLAELNRLQYECLWDPYKLRLSPRVIKGANVGANNGTIVWGEDCRKKRHFDCVSFVNYVLSKTTSRQWCYSISEYAKIPSDCLQKIDNVQDAPVAGDILLRGTGHIGMLCADNKVVQAEGHDTGVHAEASLNSSWTMRLRVLDSLIK